MSSESQKLIESPTSSEPISSEPKSGMPRWLKVLGILLLLVIFGVGIWLIVDNVNKSNDSGINNKKNNMMTTNYPRPTLPNTQTTYMPM